MEGTGSRSSAAFARVDVTYRTIALLGVVLVVLAAGATGGRLLAGGWANELDRLWLGGVLGLLVGMLGLLRWGYVQLQRDLRAAVGTHKSLIESAHRCSLTGASTRSHFLSELRDLLSDQSDPVAYMQIDMDNLKVLNDSHGHGAGDAALVHLVKVLRGLLPEALIGRLGGDEFGIALVGQDNRAGLARLGDHMLQALARPILIDGRPTRLSATIGLALWPADAAEVDDLISKADLALYKGKKSGRALTVAFESDLLADERYKRFVERDLRAALLLNELELHYQPVFPAKGGAAISHEALVRWQHPVRGRMAPSTFIPIAEQSDLIDKLGEWVLRRAVADLDRLGTPTIGINVSAVQLRRSEFAEHFAAILAECGVAGHRVIVEVTETLQLQTGAVELRNINALRELGVRVAIDDFGSGFASLEYLRGFPFDIIKIDRSYVANLPGNKVDGLIVAAVCKIARSLKVEVVAEGVETEEQRAFLVQCGCTALQGFLLARPAPLSAHTRKVASMASAA